MTSQTERIQSNVYRERIEEINAQLASLRRVTQASELSRHSGKKMEEISQLQRQPSTPST